MKLTSKRIGTIEVNDDRIIQIPEGLVGFREFKKFVLCDDPADLTMPFKWLVSVEDPEVMFLVTDPGIFFKDYIFDLCEADQKFLNVNSEDDVTVVALLTIPKDPAQITANLRGPIVVNWKTLVGRQVVLKDPRYVTKHFIFIRPNAEQASEPNSSTEKSETGSGETLSAMSTATETKEAFTTEI